MPTDLQQVAKKTLKSLAEVIDAYDECAGVIARIREEYSDNLLQISPNIEFAVWAKLRFQGDWRAFHDFVKKAVEDYSGGDLGPDDKSQLWVCETPDKQRPEPGVKRLLDSVDVGLHYCAKELRMELPAETVYEHGWHQRDHLARLHEFCLALGDVLGQEES